MTASKLSAPQTDDFRVERKDGEWVVTFTPTGARYYFGDDGMETRASDSDVPPEDLPMDYDPLGWSAWLRSSPMRPAATPPSPSPAHIPPARRKAA
jgi:hypothetical protein